MLSVHFFPLSLNFTDVLLLSNMLNFLGSAYECFFFYTYIYFFCNIIFSCLIRVPLFLYSYKFKSWWSSQPSSPQLELGGSYTRWLRWRGPQRGVGVGQACQVRRKAPPDGRKQCLEMNIGWDHTAARYGVLGGGWGRWHECGLIWWCGWPWVGTGVGDTVVFNTDNTTQRLLVSRSCGVFESHCVMGEEEEERQVDWGYLL